MENCEFMLAQCYVGLLLIVVLCLLTSDSSTMFISDSGTMFIRGRGTMFICDSGTVFISDMFKISLMNNGVI